MKVYNIETMNVNMSVPWCFQYDGYRSPVFGQECSCSSKLYKICMLHSRRLGGRYANAVLAQELCKQFVMARTCVSQRERDVLSISGVETQLDYFKEEFFHYANQWFDNTGELEMFKSDSSLTSDDKQIMIDSDTHVKSALSSFLDKSKYHSFVSPVAVNTVAPIVVRGKKTVFTDDVIASKTIARVFSLTCALSKELNTPMFHPRVMKGDKKED